MDDLIDIQHNLAEARRKLAAATDPHHRTLWQRAVEAWEEIERAAHKGQED
jgi:hypothetical protein